jgi:hypothetical protein
MPPADDLGLGPEDTEEVGAVSVVVEDCDGEDPRVAVVILPDVPVGAAVVLVAAPEVERTVPEEVVALMAQIFLFPQP